MSEHIPDFAHRWAVVMLRSSGSIEIRLSLRPGFVCDETAEEAAAEVGGTEVDASVSAGDAGFVCGISERLPT